MTHRNENTEYYGRLILDSGKVVELGRATPVILAQRIHATMVANQGLVIESFTFNANLNSNQLNKMGGAKPKYAHEGENPDSPLYGMPAEMIARIQQIDDDAPSPFEGITMSRLMEAQASDEYKAWVHMAINPENRVGISDGVIDNLRQQWQDAFPDVAAHTPIWKD